MKLQLNLKAIANANVKGIPDQGAPRGAQQTQPSDEELEQMKLNRQQEEKDKAKPTKDKEGEDTNKGSEEGEGKSPVADADDFDEDDAGSSDADGSEGGEDDEDPEEEENEEDGGEGEEDPEGEDGADDEEDSEEEEEGGGEEEDEEGSGEEETGEDDVEATASVGQKRIFRGEASSSFEYGIICAFPGVGKSYLFSNAGDLRISDSDSSTFDKSQFPMNYVDHIQKVQYENDLCLVSSHSEVRTELKARKERYLLVYPARCCKDEYLARYLRRGSNAAFVEMMDNKWDDFIDTCESEEGPTLVLQPGQYLSDVLAQLED